MTQVDGYFRGNPYFGLTSFELINEYVQNEPVQECDKVVMHGILSYLGIEKGTAFAPDTATAKLLDQAAPRHSSVHAGELESGRVFGPYWPDRSWGQFRFLYLAVGMPCRYAGASVAILYSTRTRSFLDTEEDSGSLNGRPADQRRWIGRHLSRA